MKNKVLRYATALIAALLFAAPFSYAGGSSENAKPAQQKEQTAAAPAQGPYFTGDGGKGIKLAVLEPSVNGITEDEKKWMPSTIQSSITGDFNRFSAMTIIDRQNFEKIIAEQMLSASGNFSEKDFIRIGQLINARYILTGSVIRTTTAYMLELSVTDVESGERKASYPPTPVSPLNLENLSAVKEASAKLLEQLGVRLTAQGQQELKKAPDTAAVGAEIALARGITAQRQNTEVAALSYFFQAQALNPALLEATNRASVLNANISSGNIGEDVRNDIVWRRNWVQRLTEAEQSFAEFNKTGTMLYTLFYSDEIKQGAVNYQNETVTLSIETNLRPSHTWGRTVAVPMQRTLRSVYDGLQATKRARDWSLQSWPIQSVTNLNSFARRSNSFTVAAELLNDKNQVIGRQSFRADGWWEYTYDGYVPAGIRISDDVRSTVNFTVKADDITDRLTIRIASVNGTNAETAARNGVLQIRAMPKAEYDSSSHWNDVYNFAFGEIRGLSRQNGVTSAKVSGKTYSLYIPPAIWGDPVISIGAKAFVRQVLYETPVISIYLPDSVTYIGNEAFHYYYFYYEGGGERNVGSRIISISIGANVTIEDNSIFSDRLILLQRALSKAQLEKSSQDFSNVYRRNDRKAGVYLAPEVTRGVFWKYQGPR